jgi:transcriptional regulator with XRE-family HTH domain
MARWDSHAARHILARNLRRLRLAQKMTQEQLANTGLRQALVSELESSKLDVRIDTLNRLAAALRISMSELFEDSKRG